MSLISNNIPWISFCVTLAFSILQVGSINMQVHTSIPSEIVGVLQSMIVFFFAARSALSLSSYSGRFSSVHKKSNRAKMSLKNSG